MGLAAFRYLILLAVFSWLPVSLSHAADHCEPWAAQLASVQGRVEAKRMGTERWQPVSAREFICPGDSLRVEALGRAAVLLPGETMLRLDQGTTLTFPAATADQSSWLDLLQGAVHFISRRPPKLQIKTPFVNAAIEGTEFVLRVSADQTELWVVEGRVLASNPVGSLTVTGGEAAVAKAGQAPMRLVVALRDAVRWAIYYPPLIDLRAAEYESGPAAKSLGEALERYRQGNLADALAKLDDVPPAARDASYLKLRVGLLLSVGRVDEADADIARSLSGTPDDGSALALKSVIVLAQGEREQALALARQAVEHAPDSPVTYIALSYAQQANFHLEAALDSVQKALTLDPDNALSWARLAELRLSKGDPGRALEAAKKAVQLNPNLARTQTVLGFAHLTRIEIGEARSAFQEAIVLDQADPLPRLGLGLARIRENQLEAGRQDIEIATSLDPTNSLIRSYMGKTYFEERRDKLAGIQLSMAKELDTKDPTPWFYDAIRKQLDNRPVEAVEDLQQSARLNDNRAVYRSRLLLDEDAAVRGISLARTYDDLGFDQLALQEASGSLISDPANASAHRFLSDAYANLSRHEVALVSELLQAQLLQPINISPVQPQLAETDLNLPAAAGPAQAAFDEFTPLFARDQLRLTASGLVGDHQTWGDEVVASGIANHVSYSLGQFHYDTNGFRQGSDVTHDIYDGFVQAALTPALDLQLEYRHRETEQGDLRLSYDPTFFASQRRSLDQDISRAGMHWSASPRSDLLVSLIYSERTEKVADPVVFDQHISLKERGTDAQVQYLYRGTGYDVITGGSANGIDANSHLELRAFGIVTDSTPALNEHNAYVYAHLAASRNARWTLGLSHDVFDSTYADLKKLDPKLGLQWTVAPGVQLRAAALKTLKRQLIVDQTLEPTQVAGFNQFFDDFNGSRATLYGAGIDADLSSRMHAGLEATKRKLTYPDPGAMDVFYDQDERIQRGYFYWAFDNDWTLGTGCRFERYAGAQLAPTFDRLATTSVPLTLRYFSPRGFFAHFGPTWVRQKVNVFDPVTYQNKETFTVVDGGVGYRLPGRRGLLSLEGRNLFDRKFNYQDLSFTSSDQFRINSEFIPERSVLLRLTVGFP